jgi:excisionase family DNA binding protein
VTDPLAITLPPTLIEEIAERAASIVLDRLALQDRETRWPEWMDVRTAAEYLGCTPGRVRKLVERRQVPFSQVAPGCRIFLRGRDLDRWLEGRIA